MLNEKQVKEHCEKLGQYLLDIDKTDKPTPTESIKSLISLYKQLKEWVGD